MLYLFEKFLSRSLNDPHEKIYFNVLSVLIFAVIYYIIYLLNEHAYYIDDDILYKREQTGLYFTDFLYFSLLFNFANSLGEIVPISTSVRVLTSIQTTLFWYTALY